MPIRLVRASVAAGEVAERGEHLGLRAGRRAGRARRSVRIDAGTVCVEQVVERGDADDVEHPREVVGGRPDVAGDELVVVVSWSRGGGAWRLRSRRDRFEVLVPPLSSVPESFTRRRRRAFPVGESGPGAALLSSVASPVRSAGLRDSGVGCSFGAGPCVGQRTALPDGFVRRRPDYRRRTGRSCGGNSS